MDSDTENRLRELKWYQEKAPRTQNGSGAPSYAPNRIGDVYIDTSTGRVYVAVSTASVYSWAYCGMGAIEDDYRVGLTSWYDASDSLTPQTNGSTLTGWNDKGSDGNHCTTLVNTPQYFEDVQNGLPGAYFNGSEQIYGANQADAVQPQTHFLVFKPTAWSTGTFQCPVSMSDAQAPEFKNTGTTQSGMYAGTNVYGDSIGNGCYLTTTVLNGASSSHQINDSAATTGNAGANTNTKYPIIGGFYGVYFYTGYILEWRVYDGVLTAAQQSIVKGYLNSKWAIY